MTRKPNAPRDLKRDPGVDGNDEAPRVTQAPDGQLHDADGLLVDEYSDPTIRHEPASDALDDPASLVNERILNNVADGGDGIEEIDTPESADVDLLPDGGRRVGGPSHRPERR